MIENTSMVAWGEQWIDKGTQGSLEVMDISLS